MNRSTRTLILISLAVLLGGLLLAVFFARRPGGGSEGAKAFPEVSIPALTSQERPPAPEAYPKEAAGAQPTAAAAPEYVANTATRQAILELERLLRAGAPQRDALAAMNELSDHLLNLPQDEALEAIRAYLGTGRDAETGLPFTVGPGGELTYAPTLRAFLLDILEQLDLRAAAEIAETIFGEMNSADEYALGLRSVARAGGDSTESRAYVGQRARQLLEHEPWIARPTAGFVEAFDAVVFAGDQQALPILARHAAPDAPRELNHPAFIAMDRLAIYEPEETLATLQAEEQILDDRPLTRASFFARADPNSPEQMEQVEDYLQRSDLSAAERQHFLELFPNLNLTFSHNLISGPVRGYGGDEVMARIKGALEQVQQWQTQNQSPQQADRLAEAEDRLRKLLGQ